MEPEFSPEADRVEEALYADDRHAYDRLWDVLDRIGELGEEAKYLGWASYVSSRKIWGTKVPGTDYTVFWRIANDKFTVALIVADLGV